MSIESKTSQQVRQLAPGVSSATKLAQLGLPSLGQLLHETPATHLVAKLNALKVPDLLRAKFLVAYLKAASSEECKQVASDFKNLQMTNLDARFAVLFTLENLLRSVK